MKYSQLFHACPWAKEVPYVQLPEEGTSSRPGSATSDEVDGALKGTRCSMRGLYLLPQSRFCPFPVITESMTVSSQRCPTVRDEGQSFEWLVT